MKWLALALLILSAAPAAAVNRDGPSAEIERTAPDTTKSRAVTGAIIIGALVGQASACGHKVKRTHLERMIRQVSDWATNADDWREAKGVVRKTIVAAYQQQRSNPKMTCEQVMTLIRAMERDRNTKN
ncbi:MAG: hypothetical protein OEU46_16440 [Alphaproteobacteria bacterium]|nr:hypothetical protein [Alphaproteobacteria bacterium]